MSYHHFSTIERRRIQELQSRGYSHRAIAAKLQRHRSSIDREIRRNDAQNEYNAQAAQSSYLIRRKKSTPKGKQTEDLLAIIAGKLQATWSPEQISHTVTLGKISCKTIYNWFYAGFFPETNLQNLRHKGKRRKAEKRGKFSMGTPISQRSAGVTSKSTFGHWELDTMVSSRGKSKGCFCHFCRAKKSTVHGLYNTRQDSGFYGNSDFYSSQFTTLWRI